MSNPDPSLEACTEELDDRKITVRRDGRRARFDNSDCSLIKCVDLDCLIPSADSPKADFVLAKPGIVDIIIELKGKDIAYAVEQIVATLRKWKNAPSFSRKIGGLIIFTRCPMRAAEIGDMKKRLLRQHGLWMEIDKDQKTEYRFETFTSRRP
jgi:hypothetical protein